MKKTMKFTCSLLAIALILSAVLAPAYALEETVSTADAPSELFISLYSEVFAETPTYEVYDRDGDCITSEFIAEYYESYMASDFQTIWDAVAENGYILKYGEPETVPEGEQVTSAAETVYSEWTYALANLDKLVNGKRVEFIYRLKGTYYVSSNKIVSYDTPVLEVSMTYPGSLFTYETTYKTKKATISSSKTSITFTITFCFTFCYPYSTGSIYQDTDDYTTTVTESL